MDRKPRTLSIEEARAEVRQAGLRATPARLAVIQCLAASSGPLSHVEVCAQLGDRGFDQSTIFRCLTELAEAALLHRVDMDSIRRFEYVPDEQHGGEQTEHPHFMCVDCGTIVCLPTQSLRFNVRKPVPAPVADITQILVKGHCVNCR